MNYYQTSIKKLNSLRKQDDYLILSIESSCDETAVAITRGRTVLVDVIESQIDIHKKYGGVVPEIASRNHSIKIDSALTKALKSANLKLSDISVIAATCGPGLLGALLVGLCHAKALAYALKLPFVGINHIKGHIAANYIANPSLQPPFLCLLVSGGHTEILKVTSFSDIICLGATRDDAAGEAFDKVARLLNLSYPGGPAIEKLASSYDNKSPIYMLPHPFKNEKHLDFSFSGIKTAVFNLLTIAKNRGETVNYSSLANSFENTICEILTKNAIAASQLTGIKKIALAGGVCANSKLRLYMSKSCINSNIELFLPPKSLCTDNASMIGVAAFEEIKSGTKPSDLELDADPSLEI
ncbi:MAG: tRNA (adenosine(37)-N6)-threonylcarbamoyltransferase complex transferase subunit TsaD [Christensenellaceae bacterium]|jgi:N6-L-threonylcarbamoyladenine synthase|nr:tRNA (adenosine(37)-N6)-threonylcarbamoyltransferase complex transferase subunit TsaD [Christensenellaceae bacterium]